MGISLIILLVCSALISGSETAFFSLTPGQLDSLKNNEDKKGEKVMELLSNPEYLLGTILQMNNLVNILIVLISSILIGKIFDFEGHPILEFIVSSIIVTFIIVLFGEIIPKLIGTRYPVQFAKFMSGPLGIISLFGMPFNFLMSKFTKKVTDKISLGGEITLEELSDAVDIATSSASEEKKILKGIVKLPTTSVEKIMKPRVDVVAIDIESTNEEVVKIATECGFSRLPVYQEDLDDIKGNTNFDWKNHIREAYYVPESKKINDLLEEFRSKKIHLAVVVDEYGGTDGIVTLEDILEEIIGEIVDESDFEELTELNKKLNIH